MPSSTSEPAFTRPALRQAQSSGWNWPYLKPIHKQKQPLASAAGPPSAPHSLRAPSEKSIKWADAKGSQSFTPPNQVSLPPSSILIKPPSEKNNKSTSLKGSHSSTPPSQISLPQSPTSSKPPSEKSSKSTSLKGYQSFTPPSQISLVPSPISSKPLSEKLRDPEDAPRNPSVPVASPLAAEELKSNAMVEESAFQFRMTDQANERSIFVPKRASEASTEDPPSAETGLSSLTKAFTATEEHRNPMEDAMLYTSPSVSEAAMPVAAPTVAKFPTLVELATPDELTPIEGFSPIESSSTIETPSYIKEPFAVDIRSPAEEAAEPPSAIPMTSLPPPRITFQRATEDIEPREAIPAATTADILNELPSTSHPADVISADVTSADDTSADITPADVTHVIPDPLEGESEPCLPSVKRRKLYLRKARNLAMRKTLLKAILGRQLADRTKPALERLAHGERVTPETPSVLIPTDVS